MNASVRLPNDGTGLLGEPYSRRNCPQATRDGQPAGRWIALDESGWDGDQLHGMDRSRYLTIGSVAISDEDAANLVDDLRRTTRVQAPELKFGTSFAKDGQTQRRKALVALLGPGGALEKRASVYLLDKHYFIVGKLIDLFVEEQTYKQGLDIRNTGIARKMARDLVAEGPRALGPVLFDRLLAATVAFTSYKNRDQQISVDDFYNTVEEAWARSSRRNVTRLLGLLRTTRVEAHEYLTDAFGPDASLPAALEPLIPGVAAVTANWSQRMGRVNILTDDQRALTDYHLDNIRDEARGLGHPEFRYISQDVRLGELLRGKSSDHPSLQLADLVAGAGFAVAKRHDGYITPAGEELYSVIVPLIDPAGMLSHDEPGRVAQAGIPMPTPQPR
ncbi:hypothetical protein ACIOGT_17485 [Streptomyces microflavus]|uniref:hypothetical protein n=1 Tax=Streptomyces microflavus TaxID=1919 RepID=UPI003802F477